MVNVVKFCYVHLAHCWLY